MGADAQAFHALKLFKIPEGNLSLDGKSLPTQKINEIIQRLFWRGQHAGRWGHIDPAPHTDENKTHHS